MARIEFDAAGVDVALPGGGRRVILEPTTLAFTEPRVALIGANGSGKSTLARLINGLISPTTGRVLVDGVDVARDGAAVRRRVAFSFTDPAAQLVMPTCVEDVELSLRRLRLSAAERRASALATLARFGLADHSEDSVHGLSGGQRQLLALAGVLAVEPDVLIADEPTTLLDRRNARIVGDRLMGLEQQLVLLTHDLDLAARCDRVVVLEAARVVFDGDPGAAIAAYMQSCDR